MRWRTASVAAIVLAALAAAGCASTRTEAPPDVAPQPPPITAGEAVREGEAASRQAEAPAAATRATGAAHSERFHPTTRSTREIRDQHAAAPLPLDFGERLDQVHDRLYTWGQGLVDATDHGFAASDKPLKPVPAAPFRLATTLELLDRADRLRPDIDLDFDIALRLPNLERRLRVFITSDQLDGGTRQRAEESRLRAGLGYELLRNLNFDIGVRLDLPPVAFTSLKWSREIPLGSWDFYPLAKLFAETRESVGWAAGATFDRWSGRQLLRSSSFAKWRHDRDRTAWSQTFVYARADELIVPDRYGSYISADDIGRGWGVRALAAGDDTDQVTSYEASLFYHGRTPTRWLYWYAEPFVRWDRGWNWSADPGIRVGFDLLFWDLARPAR